MQLIKKDFKLSDVDMNEEEIQATPREELKKKIKKLINISAFKQILKTKEKHSKLDEVHFSELKIQSYLKSSKIQNKEKKTAFQFEIKVSQLKIKFQETP